MKKKYIGTRIQVDTDLTESKMMRKYRIGRTTAWRAKKRGWIQLRDKKAPVNSKYRQNRLLEVLAHPAINYSEMARSVGMHPQRIGDAMRNGSSLTQEQYEALVRELAHLSAQIQRAIGVSHRDREFRLKLRLMAPINWRPLLTNAMEPLNHNEYEAVMRYKQDKTNLTPSQKERLVRALQQIRLHLAIAHA